MLDYYRDVLVRRILERSNGWAYGGRVLRSMRWPQFAAPSLSISILNSAARSAFTPLARVRQPSG